MNILNFCDPLQCDFTTFPSQSSTGTCTFLSFNAMHDPGMGPGQGRRH